VIGYYVHHQGTGHLRRARSVVARLRSEATILSSLAPPADHAGSWLELDRDDDLAGGTPTSADVTGHGTLHWVPRHSAGLRHRTRQIVDWVDEARPVLAVVDVSVEVSVLLRLAGVPLVVVAMPGQREDPPHALAYDLAELVVAPWPADAPNGWSERWRAKTHHVGAISRFDGRARPVPGPRHAGCCHGVLLGGAGGTTMDEEGVAALRRATPGWRWTVAGASSPLADDELWTALCDADVVVTHAGQGAVADVAAARAPAVVVAEPRPFDEQLGTVRALQKWDLAVGLRCWPDPGEWPSLLASARRLGGDGWARWSSGEGAARAARAIDTLARAA
jgi:hypothetical protein